MNDPASVRGADDVLDFNDIVLITMSFSNATGRVNAASICSCGSIVGPVARTAHAGVTQAYAAIAAAPPTLGERFRGFVAATLGLRAR